MESIFQSLQKKENYEKLAIDRYRVIFSRKKEIRKYLDIKKVTMLNDDVSFMGVDTSFEMLKNYLSKIEYVCIGIASWFNGEESFSDYDYEDKAIYEVETGEYESLLKGLSIFLEIEMIEKLSGKFKYAFMDRSIISLIAGINQSVVLSQRIYNQSKIAQRILDTYPEIIKKLYKILKRSGVIMAVKRSSREELKENLSQYFGQIVSNDYEIAFVILDEGEYIELPITQKYDFNLPKVELRDELFSLIKTGHIVYMKGMNNKIFKLETFDKQFPDEIVYTQTCTNSNELLILQECDTKARNYLKLFKEKSLIGGYK
ncbi:MAG: hypothetical protein QXZ43_04720 [Candidatus Aenigmatarchaeota archaeon]